ncbi:MAG: glycine--tRNA ligase subunit beta, partial [Acidimicrobiales bacterium]
MAELLFEIFCEEIPAGMQVRAGDNLAKAVTEGLIKAGLDVKNTSVFTGPRRLVYHADIPLRSPDIKEERKGPRAGAPEKALAGFMRGAGLSDISEAEIRSDKKGDFFVAMIEKEGRDAANILAELIPDVMNSFSWPKSMKSGTSSFRWVRPLQSLLCLLDGKVVDFEVGGFKSGNTTEGHRRLGRGPFTVKNFADYKKTLETKGHVILSAEARKEIILKGAKSACAKAGLELVDDPGLLDEVAGLVEWPVVMLGDMDPSFLKLPGEVIRLSMRAHQKYFAVRDPKTGDLAPNFIVVANQVAPDGGKAIAAGNSRVLSARLDDARFFQAEDAKRTLESRFDDLDGVVFHQKLGTIKDKAERVTALARELAPIVGADPDKAEIAAKLAKCDLVTNMVVEFTSLQGQIGRLMYEIEGGDKDIAVAIEDHYRPQGPADKVPTNSVAIAVALADKLDTLVGFWAINEKPTGSKDPYALRRAALGMVRLILDNNIRLDLSKQLLKGWAVLEMDNMQDPDTSGRLSDGTISGDERATIDNLVSFIIDRLKVHLRDEGVRHDLIDAVFTL